MQEVKSLKANAILNGIKQCCQILFPLITFPYVSRVLGSEGFGKYSFSFSITNYFILLAALGVNTYAIREGAKIRNDTEKVNEFCSQVYSINICSALISYILLAALVICSQKVSVYAPYIMIQSAAIIMAAIGTDWVNSIFEDYFYITVRYIIIQIIALILMFVFVRNKNDIISYCLISVFATNGGNIINLFYVRRYVKVKFTFQMEIKKHIVPLLILFINSIAVTIYVNSDITMLGFFESDTVVGVYSFSSKIYNLLKQLINAVVVVSVPRIAFVMKNQTEQYQTYMNKIFSALTMVLFPIMTGLLCMSDTIILVAGGETYISGQVSLKILSIATFFAIYASLFSNCVLIVNRQEKKCLLATVFSALVNVILNLLLLPLLGMIGAAITTCIAELVNCFFQIRFSRDYFNWRKLQLKPMLSYAIGSVVIGLICIVCNITIQDRYIRMLCCVLASGGAYGFILILLKNPYVTEVIEKIKKKNR